jgi:hypothetical protein
MEALSVWIAKHRLKQAEAGDSDGLAPARVRRGDLETGDVHSRYACGNARPCRHTDQAGVS